MTSKSSSLLIQISLLRRNSNVFTSVIYDLLDLMSRYSNNRLLSLLRTSTMTRLTRPGRASPTHQTRKLFYTTSRRQKSLASRENYASELHQVMILRLSRVDRTSCYQMVSHGRVHFILLQNIIFLCMTNCGKIDLFQTTWTKFYRICPREDSVIAGVAFFIH